MTISIYNADQQELNAVLATTVHETGNYVTPAFTPGTYRIHIKVDGYLAQLYSDVVIAAGSYVLDLSGLIAGDLNNTNNINILDVSIICSAFGSTIGDESYIAITDLNCDGFIYLIDISFINCNFGLDNPPVME